MLPQKARLGALIGLLLCVNIAAAGVVDPLWMLRRDGTTTSAPSSTKDIASSSAAPASATSAAPSSTETTNDDKKTAAASSSASRTANTQASTQSSTQSTTEATTTSAPGSSSVLSSAIATSTSTSTVSLNDTLFNSTIPAGQLPLKPVLTPGWGVAGIILLVTGAVYGLIGIKKQWLHTYFSTAYLGSLGTTVLIVYVMSPPVRDAIQGAYVVAVVVTGVILGGIALVFKEITEGLGCMLGGFCFSMWLLCLHEGGLLQDSTGKVVFIIVFTVVGFAFSFSHWTRQYALIICISFAGATVTVLGIDAFSRAGLKEFWAYIWSLNDNLFPLGADTYPLTKGIRVELAVNILLFLAGIVSQMKLWRIVQERRAKRDAARAEDERNLQAEEENVGRQVERANARDREQWEAVYGDGTIVATTRTSENDSAIDSGVGDMESEKKEMQAAATQLSPRTENGDEVESPTQPIELAELEASRPKAAAEMVLAQDENNGAVTVRVAQDEYPEGAPPTEAASAVEPVAGQLSIRRVSKNSAGKVTAGPEIVPLPFKIPGAAEEGEDAERRSQGDDDRSSVATFADEDDVPRPRNRSSLAKRLSRGSVELFHSMSQRSKRASSVFDKNGDGQPGESSEELVVSPRSTRLADMHNDKDDNSSVAATVDGISSDGVDIDTLREEEEEEEIADKTDKPSRNIEVHAQLSDSITAPDTPVASKETEESLAPPKEDNAGERPLSAQTVSTEILGVQSSVSAAADAATDAAPKATSTAEKEDNEETATTTGLSAERGTPSRKTPSVASVDSTPVSLTKAHLPRSLSRIALSYRTNEWAKHLSNADMPEPESLQIVDDHRQQASPPTTDEHDSSEAKAMVDSEVPARLNVSELQQTAETGAPAPAAPRSASAMSSASPAATQPGLLSRSASYQSLTAQDVARNSFAAAGANGYRSMSASHSGRRPSALHPEPIAEENDATRAQNNIYPVVEGEVSPTESSVGDLSATQNRQSNMAPIPGVVSYSSPQTFIGQRDILLRSKSQQGMYIGGPLVTSESMNSMGSLGIMNRSNSMLPVIPSSGASDNGGSSVYSFHSAYPGVDGMAPPSIADPDDMPMSQRRKELMRQNSYLSMVGGQPVNFVASQPAPKADNVNFNSHQPQRGAAHLPTSAVREARLATFRNSVAAELKAASPGSAPTGLRESMSTPFVSASTAPLSSPSSHDVQHAIDMQRQYLLSQKDAEAQRRYMEKQDKERNDRAFEQMMRRGDLMEAHRDAMRRMQASARES